MAGNSARSWSTSIRSASTPGASRRPKSPRWSERKTSILPAGTTKIGTQEYPVVLNSSPLKAEDLNNLPIKTVNGVTDLPEGRGPRARRIPGPDQPRPRRGQAGRPPIDPQKRRRLDPRHRGRSQEDARRHSGRHPPGPQGHAALRPVALCPRLRRGRGQGGGDRGRPDRPHDPHLPRQLAQHRGRDHRRSRSPFSSRSSS